jgi:hypothetical protein
MSIEDLDGGTPSTTSFSQILDGGLPNTTVFGAQEDAGGAIRGQAITAQGDQNAISYQQGVASVATAQGGETVHATGTVVSNTAATSQGGETAAATGTVGISGAASTSQHQYTNAAGTIAITGTANTAQGSETTHATNVETLGSVTTAQGSETTHATGTVRPYVPPQPVQPTGQYGGGMGGGGGVAGGYVISLAGFRRKTIEITVCIPGEEPCTLEVQQQEIVPVVSMGHIQHPARNVQVTAHNLMNVLAKRPAYNLTEIINTTESNVGAKVLFKQPKAQINDIITIDT